MSRLIKMNYSDFSRFVETVHTVTEYHLHKTKMNAIGHLAKKEIPDPLTSELIRTRDLINKIDGAFANCSFEHTLYSLNEVEKEDICGECGQVNMLKIEKDWEK